MRAHTYSNGRDEGPRGQRRTLETFESGHIASDLAFGVQTPDTESFVIVSCTLDENAILGFRLGEDRR